MNPASRFARTVLTGLLLAAPLVTPVVSRPAFAQPLAEPAPDAAAASSKPAVREAPAPGPVTPRPDPGPSLRERGARTRRGNPASGVLLVFVLVGAIGWWVMKRLKRY